MLFRRRLTGLLAPAVLIVLPACGGNGPLLPLRPDPPVFPPPASVTTHPAEKVPFAGTRPPITPGEMVLRHPPTPEPARLPDHPVTVMVEAVKENIDNPIPPPPPASPPAEPDPPLVAAVRDFLAGKPDAADRLKPLPPANQEVLLQLLPPVARVAQMDLTRPDAEETAVLARQFETAAAVLARRAGLTVKKAVLCLDVKGFGRFTPVRDRNDLRRGEMYPLYVEVGNVPCEPHTRSDGADGFQTLLEVSMQVTDEQGKVLEIIDPRTGQPGPKSTTLKTEFSRSPVRDYHVIAQMQAPTRPGGYTVTIELRDPKSGTVVSRPVPFRVSSVADR
jgi:hypothetical protein